MSETKVVMQSSFYDNCVRVYNIIILDLFNTELQLMNTKPTIKNKLKDLLGELKKFKVLSMLVLEHKKTDDHKTMHNIFHLSD